MKLGGPLKSIWRADTKIKNRFQYSTACQMLCISRANTGISRALGKLDYCSDCKVFDELVAPDAKRKLFEVEKALEDLNADYLKDWQWICKDQGWLDEDYPKHESSEFITEHGKYIEMKHSDCVLLEGASIEAHKENGKLRMVEAECCQTLKKLAQEVVGYQLHWAVRD